ncbi:MAG: PAS domain S-box protein [Proteobacteria bacterium]|nr:PAS domain S-box protein [Pseudomonadota bacterium]
MGKKPDYEQLLQRVKELEKKALDNRKFRTRLQESEERLRSIIDNSTAVIYLKDLTGRYLLINKYYEQLFQLTGKQVIGKTDFDIFPRKNAELFHANDMAVIEKNLSMEFEELVPHNDGMHTFISIKFPLHNIDGDIYAVCGISTDITERKRVEVLLQKSHDDLDQLIKERTSDLIRANEQLKREIEERKLAEKALLISEKKFRNIFENLKDVYFETSLDGQIINASPSSVDFSGYALDELIGHTVDILYDNPKDREDLLKELMSKGVIRDFEAVFKKKTGEPYHVSVNADIYYNESNQPAGMTGTIRDITQHKKMKERLQRTGKMESLGLMAGGIAHDLNNILSGIVTYPEVLLMNLPDDSPLKKPIQIIQDAGKRAADVVFDLLTIAKGVATGKDVFNLNTIIREFLDSGEYRKIMADHPDIHFANNLDPELLNMVCSSPHIKIILLNLIMNASEAIKGEGIVTLKTTNQFLEKSLRLH